METTLLSTLPFLRREALPALRREVMARDHYLCQYCGAPATELDHVQPWSRGGLTIAGNLAAACVACNHGKGDRTPEEWRQEQALAHFARLLAERRTRRGAIKAAMTKQSTPSGPPPLALAALARLAARSA
jgi:5-methylcytosine-specific restriction endonuclease McrA